MRRVALVTGASGFVGRWMIESLRKRGFRVKAGIRRTAHARYFAGFHDVETITIDILDRQSLVRAMKDVDSVYHFAALVDAMASGDDLFRVNEEGTRKVWECAAASGVSAALYCSSAAVYGLLASSDQPITEDVRPKAVEPYGRSKLAGESIALEVAEKSGLPTIIIRPVGLFGPGEHTPVGVALRSAAFSSFLLARAVKDRKFSYAHVEDVSEAAAHLMHREGCEGQVFNVVVDNPISFDEAFEAYLRVLNRSGYPLGRAKLLGNVSVLMQKLPSITHLLSRSAGRLGFTVWRPEFFITYSSKKLLETSFRFKWARFEELLQSCMNDFAHC